MTQHVQAPDGVILATSSRGNGVPVVFSNSLASDQSMWNEVIEALSGRVQAITYDTVGHGASSLAPNDLSIDALAGHALCVARHYTDGPFLFCGLSLGGLTGMRLAVREPLAVQGLVLANTAPSFPPSKMWFERADTARKEGLDQLVAPTVDRWLTPEFRARNPVRTAEIEMMISGIPSSGYARACHVLGTTDVSEILPRIACPTIVIAGERDLSTPPDRAKEIVAAVPNASLRLVQAAHLSSLEFPGVFAEAIQNLAEQTSKRKVA